MRALVGELFASVSSPRQWALINAMLELGGGGKECEIQREAENHLPPGETVHGRLGHERHDYFSPAIDALVAKGIADKHPFGKHTEYWLTQNAWDASGNHGPVPGPQQQGLF